MSATDHLNKLLNLKDAINEIDQLKSELAQAKSEFKNFHRMVCESAGYHHDEIDWKRDQASLVNHIESKLTLAISALENIECGEGTITGFTHHNIQMDADYELSREDLMFIARDCLKQIRGEKNG